MKFEYILNGIGWADVKMYIDGKKYYSFPSYISEPLIDLCEGLLSIIPDCVSDDELKLISCFKWFQEPSIDKWTIRLMDNSKLKILIEHFEHESSDKGEIEFEGACGLIDFLKEVTKSLEALLNKHGFIGYKDTWYGQDFPFSSYLKLKYYLISKGAFPTSEEPNVYGVEVFKSNLQDEINILLENIGNV